MRTTDTCFCPINRFSLKVNLANADNVDVPSASVNRTRWIIDVNFRLFWHQANLCREQFWLSSIIMIDFWVFLRIWTVEWQLFEGQRCLIWRCFRPLLFVLYFALTKDGYFHFPFSVCIDGVWLLLKQLRPLGQRKYICSYESAIVSQTKLFFVKWN